MTRFPHPFLLSAVLSLVADGFSITTNHVRHSHRPSTSLKLNTLEETAMTTEDETILFGKNDSPTNSVRHKTRTGNLLNGVSVNDELGYSATDPLVNKLRTVRETITSCSQLWSHLAEHCPDKPALLDEHHCDKTVKLSFKEMDDLVKRSCAAFTALGVAGKNVAMFAENSAYWLVADQGIQLAGGASAVRGADAPLEELRYIYENCDSAGIAVLQGPKLFLKLAKDAKAKGLNGIGLQNGAHGPLKTVVLLNREKKTDEEISEMEAKYGVKIHILAHLLEAMDRVPKVADVGFDDLATIVYTSGTTGRPKGVMLTHGNLIHQLGHRLGPSMGYEEAEPLPGETMLSLLPVWHITERTFELWMASRGCNIVYSSIRAFRNDLATHKPQWLVLVPRVLEKIANGVQDKFASGGAVTNALVQLFSSTSKTACIHEKIAQGLVVGEEEPSFLKRIMSRARVTALAPINVVGDKLVWQKVRDGFGGRLKVIISGGSALSGALENFYEMAGFTICVGYGLTECSPLLAFRRRDSNLVVGGCVGRPTENTEIRVVDPEDTERKPLRNGDSGLVLARGPQIMLGYYKNEKATKVAIDDYGWFDTGDLGTINPATGDLILTGRCKDTIVLSNGENIEPAAIEEAILSVSPLIDQVMLAGQDGRRLVAIIVLNPSTLHNAGFLKDAEGKDLQKVFDQVNDPQCNEEDSAWGCDKLENAAKSLRSNDELKNTLSKAVKEATRTFRKWEQVGDIYTTLEPFAMANGQLTQSYKIKRDSVMHRYENVIQ